MSDHEQLACGYSVTARRKRYLEVEMVMLHKLGSSEHGYFTPHEARVLADALLRAAKAAEASSATEIYAATEVYTNTDKVRK